jgi:ABC-2 type transport system permease protein
LSLAAPLVVGSADAVAGVLIAALASSTDIGVAFGDAVLQAVVTIPAVWMITAVSVAVVGARPQVPLAALVGVVAAFGLTLLGPTFKLWDWVLAISPFWHIPNVAEAGADWSGLAWVSLVTVVFVVVGFAGFRRRDLATT